MFSAIIERWVLLATWSDDPEIRIGNHMRDSDWPKPLVLAENERFIFDNRLCWWTSCRLDVYNNRAIAFAMATHPRLGAHSSAMVLVADIMRQITRPHIIPDFQNVYREFLLEQMPYKVHSPWVDMACLPTTQQVLQGPFRMVGEDCTPSRFMVRSELDGRPAYSWPGRTQYFFNHRGWFSGVDKQHAPQEVVTDPDVTGVYESIPHIFCDTWFPVCRPYAACRHLIHVSSSQPHAPKTP